MRLVVSLLLAMIIGYYIAGILTAITNVKHLAPDLQNYKIAEEV